MLGELKMEDTEANHVEKVMWTTHVAKEALWNFITEFETRPLHEDAEKVQILPRSDEPEAYKRLLSWLDKVAARSACDDLFPFPKEDMG